MSRDKPCPRPVREDYERALKSMDTYMDIGLEDLMKLSERAQHFAAQRSTESITVATIMTDSVRSISPRSSLSQAAHLMVTERISGLPVVDERGKLQGLITEADLLRGVGLPSHHPAHNLWQTLESLFQHLSEHTEINSPHDPVSAYMVRDVICTSPEQSVESVLETMKQHRVKRVIVCKGDREPVGIVTRSDLLRIFFDRFFQTDRVPKNSD